MRLPRLPQSGETVGGGEFVQAFGGKGANQAVAVARAGGSVDFLTGIGDDSHGEAMKQNFIRENIDASHALLVPKMASGCALILVDSLGNNSIAVAPGANGVLTPKYVNSKREIIERSALLLLQMEIPVETVRKAIKVARESETPTLLNYAPAESTMISLLRGVTGLVVNEVEAETLCGVHPANLMEAAHACSKLKGLGIKFVIVTLGGQGVAFIGEKESGHLPAFPANAVDTTAAGDTFCGALAVAIVEGRSLRDAIIFASSAASCSVETFGAQPSIPFRNDIETRLARGF